MRVFHCLITLTFAMLDCSAFMVAPTRNALVEKNLHKMEYLVHLRGGAEKPMDVAGKVVVLSSVSLLTQMVTFVKSNPIIGNSFVCMGLSAVGDLLAQKFEQYERNSKLDPSIKPKNEPLDITRAATLASFGLLVCGPLYSAWYPFVHQLCKPWSLATYGVWVPPIVKMVLELAFVEPLFLISFFFYMNFAKGGNFTTFKETVLSELLATYKISLSFWPPIMLLSFRFVPVAALPIVVNIANAFWDAFLSYQNYHNDVVKH